MRRHAGARLSREIQAMLADVETAEARRNAAWLSGRLGLLPAMWARHVAVEHARRGGVSCAAANSFLLDLTDSGDGRVPLSASDEDLRAAARRAAGEAAGVVADALQGLWGGVAGVFDALGRYCARWGVLPAAVGGGGVEPAIRRMTCSRWWLRRLRRAHGRRAEGAAVRAGVVRRGLWPYASQDAVQRRADQRRRNARAVDGAVLSCAESGEVLPLGEVVEKSLANPENRRSELMVRVRGCDDFAQGAGFSCEFWTLTAPSRFHAQKILGATAEANSEYGVLRDGERVTKNLDSVTPRAAQGYISSVWARARAAWKRRGLVVYGLRTAEPHHDGCPHWHLVVYGPARDLRFARRLLRVYALRDSGNEAGARRRRFVYLKAKEGTWGAAYAAKYISKNINGEGMGACRDSETGRKVASTARRVDAWAGHWGIRQFQFFGTPAVTLWRTLRRFDGPIAVVGSALEQARQKADDSDFCGFWQAVLRGGVALLKRASEKLTVYGDLAADKIVGVVEGGRRALLPVKTWAISWGGKAAAGVGFDLPWSCVNNCTGGGGGGGDLAAVAGVILEVA